MSQVKFVITNAGLNEAIKAQEEGLLVKITEFTVGNGYGYEPSVNDIDLHGSTLYRGKPAKYRYLSQSTKLFVCNLPANIGPFSFGEVGLWTDTGILFALCSFPQPIQKYSSLEDTVSSSVTFNCILTIEQGSTTVTLDYEDNPDNLGNEIENIESWLHVKAPDLMNFSPITQQLLVQQLSKDGRQTLLLRNQTDNRWDVASTYGIIKNAVPMLSATATNLVVRNDGSVIDPTILSTEKEHYLLQINSNHFRLATASIAEQGIRFSWLEPIEDFRSSNLLNIFEPDKLLAQLTVNQLKGDIPWERISGKPDFGTQIQQSVPTGMIAMMPVKSVPTGWLYCNGAQVSRTTYARLFSVIGTTYGAGNGSTTFNLPDYRGYFPRFLDDGRGIDSERTRGIGSVQSDGAPDITGRFTATDRGGRGQSRNGAFYDQNRWNTEYRDGSGDSWGYNAGFAASRCSGLYGRSPNEIRVKNMTVFPIIKYQ